MNVQQLLTMETAGGTVRDTAFGWLGEDPRGFVPDKPIGFTPGARLPRYETPLAAMAAGWHLLAPPDRASNDTWAWWLVRDVPVMP